MAQRMIDAQALASESISDLLVGLSRWELWWRFAVSDIRQRFRRSTIGPLWITLSTAILIAALALVLSTISQVNLEGVLLYVATGVILWGFLSTCLSEGANVFIGSAGYIRNVPVQHSVHVYRMIARNFIIFGFNMVIYLVVLAIYPRSPSWNYLLFVPGFALYMINIGWASLAAAILSARFRDVPQIVANLLQVLFIFTPVFWSPESLPNRPYFVDFNPAYHLLELVRRPLLGSQPQPLSWIIGVLCAVCGTVFMLVLYRRAYGRIAYWV